MEMQSLGVFGLESGAQRQLLVNEVLAMGRSMLSRIWERQEVK